MNALQVLVTLILVFQSPVRSQLTENDVPGNLTLLKVTGRHAHIGWRSVKLAFMANCYPRYVVRVWSQYGNDTFRILPRLNSTEVPYFPGAVNNVTVSVSSCDSLGPPSNVLSFEAPEAEPPKPEFLNVHQLGNDSVMVTWYQSRERTGKLFGYHLFYADLSKEFSMENANHYEVLDVDHEQAKLSDLTEEATYKVGVYAVNKAGNSKINYKEFRLHRLRAQRPGKPTFTLKLHYSPQKLDDHNEKHADSYEPTTTASEHLQKISTTLKPELAVTQPQTVETRKRNNCTTSLKVVWHPNYDVHAGDYFKVKMKTAEEEEYNTVWTQYSEDYILTNSYDACKVHQVIVTSVDGQYETDSDVRDIPVVRG